LLAFLLLLGSLLLPTSLLLLAFTLTLGCHQLVSHSMLTATNFPRASKTATFLESGRDDGQLAPHDLSDISEPIAMLPPFGAIEGHHWFFNLANESI
jgi:hypothetical protein